MDDSASVKIRTSTYGMCRNLLDILGILGLHCTPLCNGVSMENQYEF